MKSIYQKSIDKLNSYPKFIKYEKPFDCDCYQKTFIFSCENFTLRSDENTYLKSLNQCIKYRKIIEEIIL